jgi:hypothetical protein
MSRTDKSVWVSGELCEASAVYFADNCGHPIKKDYRKLDVFSRCPKCDQALRWTRLGAAASTSPDAENPRKFT